MKDHVWSGSVQSVQSSQFCGPEQRKARLPSEGTGTPPSKIRRVIWLTASAEYSARLAWSSNSAGRTLHFLNVGRSERCYLDEKRAIRRCAGQRLENRRVSLDPKDSSARPNGRPKTEAQRVEVFVNKENEERISNGLLGTGTQMPSPSPDPFSC